jgi:hypothetical protein
VRRTSVCNSIEEHGNLVALRLGLQGWRESHHQTVGGMMMMPFQRDSA